MPFQLILAASREAVTEVQLTGGNLSGHPVGVGSLILLSSALSFPGTEAGASRARPVTSEQFKGALA